MAAVCTLYISLVCNGITLTTPGGYWNESDKKFQATPNELALVQHMLGRIWAGNGTVTAPVPSIEQCKSVSINETCGQFSVNYMAWDGVYELDATEAALIKTIWGPFWTAGGTLPNPLIMPTDAVPPPPKSTTSSTTITNSTTTGSQ